MKVTLPDYTDSHVLVVGDVMLDRYWHGSTSRISPEAPVPVVKIDQLEERPGGGANVAMNVTSLGGSARLISLTGTDEAANILEQQVQRYGITADFIALSAYPTITKLRVLSRHQQLIRLDFENGFNDADPAPLLARVEQALSQTKILVLSDYAKGVLNSVQQMIQLAKAKQIPVLIDPKGTDFERYRGATILTPNMAEFEAVVGPCHSDDEIVSKGLQLIAQYDFDSLLITRSEKGMTLLQKGQAPLHLPTQAKEVYDVTGAGDTVIATLAASLAAGKALDEACVLANAAAGIVVGKLGTSTVTAVELEDVLRARANTSFGVMGEAQLKEAIKDARQRGEKIVMTNGCFDILHAGHVSYLENARKLGDRLIVAVNSDASVKQLKGPSRPINPLAQRMIVLSALSAVDWVVPFEEETPQRLIAEILPDILVKGGDYQPEQIAGGAEVIAAGGEVQVLNFQDGCSTSNIINRIKQQD